MSGVVRRRRRHRRLGDDALVRTMVSDNHAEAVQSDGGGVVVESGASLTLRDSTVSRNSASAAPPTGRLVAGGGIFVTAGRSPWTTAPIDRNTSSLATHSQSPYPVQDGPDRQTRSLAASSLATGQAPRSATRRSTRTRSQSTPWRTKRSVPTPAVGVWRRAPHHHEQQDCRQHPDRKRRRATNGPGGSTLEADWDTLITGTRIAGNTTTVTAPDGNAGALGAVLLFPGGPETPTIHGQPHHRQYLQRERAQRDGDGAGRRHHQQRPPPAHRRSRSGKPGGRERAYRLCRRRRHLERQSVRRLNPIALAGPD